MTPEQIRTLRGPLLVRTAGEQSSTFDQRLLQSGADHEWQHADPWRVLRIQGEFVDGFDALAKLPKAVTVFGSARSKEGDPNYELGVAMVMSAKLPGANCSSTKVNKDTAISDSTIRSSRRRA